MSLSKPLYPLLSTGSTREDPPQHDWKSVDCDIKNKTKQNKNVCSLKWVLYLQYLNLIPCNYAWWSILIVLKHWKENLFGDKRNTGFNWHLFNHFFKDIAGRIVLHHVPKILCCSLHSNWPWKQRYDFQPVHENLVSFTYPSRKTQTIMHRCTVLSEL